MKQDNLYLSKHQTYLSLLDRESVEEVIFKVLDLDQGEQKLLCDMRKQSRSKNCGQQIIPKEYFINCLDCGIQKNHLFCQPCFDEDLHKNHYIKLLRKDQGLGYCDCGDSDFIKPDAFCKSHSKQIIEEQFNDQEIHLIGKLKILLEISCYSSIILLEQIAKLPIIQAHQYIIQNSQFLQQSLKLKQYAYLAYKQMNQIIIYLTGSNQKLNELVSQVFTSSVPQSLQQIEQFQHNHKQIFQIGMVIENNTSQPCQCSVLKNLLRYIIFLSREFKQELYIGKYLSHLLIDTYAEVITKTFVEMIPFQIQTFNKCKFYCEDIEMEFNLFVPQQNQQQTDDYLYFQEINDLNCIKISTKDVQLISELFEIYFQLQQKIIQQFQFHKDQIEYVGQFIQQGVLTSKRFSKILQDLKVNLFKFFNQTQIEFCLNEFFLINPTDSYAYRTILSLIPCKPFSSHQKHKIKDIFIFINIQEQIIGQFDQNFLKLIQNCQDQHQKLKLTKIILQGLIQKIIETYPMNQDQFELGILKFIYSQFILADHIFIILLSFYCQLKYTENGEQFIQILTQDLQISQHQLKQFFHNLVQRAIQKLVLFNDSQFYIYYSRKTTIYEVNNVQSEFSQESLDRSIVQMYFFLYGEEAIVITYNYVESANEIFKTNFCRDSLIYAALSSDFDMYQTCSHYFKDELPQDFKASLRKVIKSLYYAQNYFSYNQILDNLNKLGNNQLNMLNQNSLLEILELDPYSGQLKLKKQFQPPLFEPLFSSSNQAIFKQIQDKLNQNNNKEINVFGDSLEFDFQCTDENLKTLSGIRKYIINQLLKGQNMIASILQAQINDENIKRNCIKANKCLIYFFIMAFKYLKLPEQNQQALQQLFDLIKDFDSQDDIICILKQKIIGNKQVVEEQPKTNHSQKLLQLKQKFQKKQLEFENNIDKDSNIIKDQYDPNLICNLCAQQMDSNLDDAYSLALLQLNNNIIYYSQFKDLQYLQYLEKFSPSLSEITLCGCTHIFHFKCIKKLNVIEIYDESFYQCIICKCLGNKIFPVGTFNQNSLFQDVEYFTIISKTDMLGYYYETYNINGELDIKSITAEIILQIYLFYIRQIIGNAGFYDNLENIQRFKQFTVLIKEQINEQIKNQYNIIIHKYSQSAVFQIVQQILHQNFNLETQQFAQDILKILVDFGLLDLYDKEIFQKLFKYKPEIQQFEKLRGIIQQQVEQYPQLRDLQRRVIQKCIYCQKFSQYICLGCNQKVCNSFQVVLNYRKSCCYIHSLKCHNGKVNILDAQTGEGFISYQSEIVLYQKSLFKTKLGQQFEGDYLNSSLYLADTLALQEFYNIQIHNKQMTYIIKNMK